MTGYVDAKGNHQQCEIDIVAISADDKEAFIFEVKRNAEKYDARLMEEKVSFFSQKEKRIRKYKQSIACLSLMDM